MGWFDNDATKQTTQAPEAPGQVDVPRRSQAPDPAAPPAGTAGSTIGERVHIKGTIVSDEDLTILGKVEGTIHARRTLVIAKGAEVEAVVHGCKVVLEGAVAGDVHGAEAVVLGATASLVGNLTVPSLQIHEGAYFRGSVAMKKQPGVARPAVPARQANEAADRAKAAGSKPTRDAKTKTPSDGVPSGRNPVAPGRGA